VVAAVVVAGGGFVALKTLGKDDHAYEVDWPESSPTGERVRVGAPRPGDSFKTLYETKNRIALAADYADPNQGMTLDAKLEIAHDVAAREGGGARSTLRWRLVEALSNIPGRQPELATVLGTSEFTLVQDRDEAGRRVGGTPLPPLQGTAIGLLFSGFVDPTLSFLPKGRDVRVGEVWKLFEEVDELRGMESAVRVVTETSGEGFPELLRNGVVQAEAVEDHEGQKALRLKVLFTLSMDGDTRPPAPAGRISMGGKSEGAVWVSLSSGLPLSLRLDSTLRSTLRRDGAANVERAIRQSIRSTTR
jgi:hypothetical protein